jgi:soluble lytic murein transglycosylase-like protein
MAYTSYGAAASNTLRRTGLYGVLFVAPLAFALAASPSAEAQRVRTASLPPPDGIIDKTGVSAVLTSDDTLHYQHIFAMQHAGSWTAADHEISLLRDRLLMGTVLAQRYLDPHYRTSYEELIGWLRLYADEPDARAIYALALKRRPSGAPAPTRPAGAEPALRFGPPDEIESRHGEGAAARDPEVNDLSNLPFSVETTSRPSIAPLPFQHGGAEASQAFALEVIPGSERGGADWEAGLLAWRRERYAEACEHFERATRVTGAGPGQIAAAGSELRNHHPEHVDGWLGIAAQHPHTFYGLLARRTLGIDATFNFDTGPLNDASARLLLGTVPGRRALALIQVGSTTAAEAMLRQVAAHGDAALLQAVEALADRAGMPSLSFQLATLLAHSDASLLDRAMFPIPRWAPLGGFKVDRAFLFALMRQESQFRSDVRSASGALGPMQIMPATARSMAQRLSLSSEQRRDLADPAVNLALAQEYIAQLQADDRVGSNLLLLAAAYNSGPGPIHQWLGNDALRNDPLLFLESIPNRETRFFAERVLANYWIYRLRLGQPTPDLDALAAGQWPTYTALDGSGGRGGSYAKN